MAWPSAAYRCCTGLLVPLLGHRLSSDHRYLLLAKSYCYSGTVVLVYPDAHMACGSCREINRGGLLLIYQILVDTAQADIAKALQASPDEQGRLLGKDVRVKKTWNGGLEAQQSV